MLLFAALGFDAEIDDSTDCSSDGVTFSISISMA